MDKNTSRNRPAKYDTAYINPCVDKVLEAIAFQKEKENVLLVFQKQLNRSDSFQVTQTFPFNLLRIFRSARRSRLLKNIFLLSPHLIQPQKVIYQQARNLNFYRKIIDLIFRNQLKEKSAVLNQQVPENLSFLHFDKLQGLVFQEFKINVSRLFIALLRHFESLGGKIMIKETFPSEEIKTIIQCQSQNKSSFLSNINSPSGFALVAKSKKMRFRLLDQNKLLQIDFFNSKKQKISTQKAFEEIKKIAIKQPATLKEMEFTSYLSEKSISTIYKIIKEPLPGSYANTQLKDNYELSLEKFDLAKQTGISYPDFKILFHRYGTGIEEMIDIAYEKMNTSRDSKAIWDQTENWFQRKYEWKVE